MTEQERLGLATRIMAGLLASGHYTTVYKKYGPGAIYESAEPAEDDISIAAQDAVTLLRELEEELNRRP